MLAILWISVIPSQTTSTSLEGPMSYFSRACSRCHGVEGRQYAPDMLRRRSLASLKAEILDMADGPGMAPLSSKDLAAQVELHRAFLTKKPFVFVASVGKAGCSGEAFGLKEITLINGKKQWKVKVVEGLWKIEKAGPLGREALLKWPGGQLRVAPGSFSMSKQVS